MKMQELSESIENEIKRWEEINEHGCNDPFWTDGCNMNLVRNHIISYKCLMLEEQDRTGEELPESFYYQTPPEVDNYYMADLRRNRRRVERLKNDARLSGRTLHAGRLTYQKEQLSIFG